MEYGETAAACAFEHCRVSGAGGKSRSFRHLTPASITRASVLQAGSRRVQVCGARRLSDVVGDAPLIPLDSRTTEPTFHILPPFITLVPRALSGAPRCDSLTLFGKYKLYAVVYRIGKSHRICRCLFPYLRSTLLAGWTALRCSDRQFGYFWFQQFYSDVLPPLTQASLWHLSGGLQV